LTFSKLKDEKDVYNNDFSLFRILNYLIWQETEIKKQMSQEIAKILDLYNQENLSSGFFIVFLNYVLCVLCAFVLKILYENKSSSLSGKFHVGTIIPILSQIIFLIILIVKSSLALSLGLIGALSIVRFRTPIKEPEELIYLFFSIAIGIGFGAGQTMLTSLIFVFIITTIFFFSSKKNTSKIIDYNLLLEIPYTKDQNPQQNQAMEIFKKIFQNFNISKIEVDDGIKLLIVFEISSTDVEKISEFENKIKSKYNNAKITYFENKILT